MVDALGKTLRNLPGPVLITGHTGFKGTWMTLLLQELGISVIGYSLEPEKDSLYDRANLNGNITEKIGDIRDHKKLKKFIKKHQPSVIIHMAAQPIVLESHRIPRETFEVNVMGTANLLEIVSNMESVRVVLVVTTDKVYRNDNTGKAFIETDPLEGKDPYSASKVGAESVIAAWQQISETSGGPQIIAARAGNVIGGGDFAENRLIPDIIRSCIHGTTLQIRNPASTRPWLHVLDVLTGYILAIEKILLGCRIRKLNFGPKESNLNVEDIVQIMSKDMDFNFSVDTQKNVNKPQFYEASTLNLNSKVANSILGWEPKLNQLESLNLTVTWWQQILVNKQPAKKVCIKDIQEYII